MHPILRTAIGLATSFALALALTATAATAQTKHRDTVKTAPKDYSPEFLPLLNAWRGALQEYGTKMLTYDRANAALPAEKRDTKSRPVHPAAEWWKRFEDLAYGKDLEHPGDADALAWLVEQSANAFEQPAQRADAAEKAFAELVRSHPDHRTVEDALDSLRPAYEALGKARFVALLDSVQAKSTDTQLQARALVLKAWAVSDRFQDTSPEREREVQEIYQEILLGHPETRAAREIAGRVEDRLEREYLQAELAWVAAVRELEKQGKDQKSWPRQPMHEWNDKYLSVANAGGPKARKFVNHVYPAYQQAEGNSLGLGLVWLQAYWMQYMTGPTDEWLRARLGLLEILAREFHGQPLLTSALVDFSQQVGAVPLEDLERALAPVFADPSIPKAQALALFIRASANSAANEWKTWQVARKDLEQLLAQHASEEIAKRAQDLLTSMGNVWPGKQAPDFRGTDQDGLAFTLGDYKGFVCVIDFGHVASGVEPQGIARRKELIHAHEGRPFRWIGGLLDPVTPKMFRETLGAAGVNWRVALLGTRDSDIGSLWSILVTPVNFVVDAEGVIRARNLPWDEQTKLIEKLVAEAEAKREKK